MAVLTVDNLTVKLNKNEILQNISFKVPKGSCTAIIGPNGCGKSTLLKAVAGLNGSYGGQIFLNGQNLKSLSRRQLAQTMAFLPQGAVTPEDLTVKELVAYGRFPYRSLFSGSETEAERKIINEAMQKTRVAEMAERRLLNLSGGERQRAWIAMALAQQPQILLLDEPTTYLDIAHQLEVMQTITELNKKENITVLMVLHDINHARIYADNVIVIKDKKIFAEGVPGAVLNTGTLAQVFGVKAEFYANGGGKIIFPVSLINNNGSNNKC